MTQTDFISDLGTALGANNLTDRLVQLVESMNLTTAGAMAANVSQAVDVSAASDVLGQLASQISNDTQASGKQWAELASSINFTSVGQILSSLSNPLTTDQLSTVGSELLTAVDYTGVGYFLGNVTKIYDQSTYGSLLNQLLATVNFTQVGAMAESMPSVVTGMQGAGTALGQIVSNANFTQAGTVVNSYIALLGTTLQGCEN